jgi:hypothetical protein
MPKENVELLRELYSANGLAAIRCVCPAPQGALRRGPKGNLGKTSARDRFHIRGL